LKHFHCLFPSTCCMSTLFAHALPSSPCMLVFTCLLHVRLICAYFVIVALCACFCLCAYFHLLVACPPHLHLLHHHCLACLLLPSCYMSTLFTPISALPPCVTPFAHVLISTCLLHVYLVCTYSTITAMCACFCLLTSYPPHFRMLHHHRLMWLLLLASLLPPPSTIAINLVLGIKRLLRYLLADLLAYLLVYLFWASSLPSCLVLSPYMFV
jgi:hypothetical protein